jgi:hypothetical protein
VEKDVHSCMRNAHTTNAPRNEKKKINVKVNSSGSSKTNELLTVVTHQCIIFVAAGTEIITVKVLKSIRVV